MRSRSISRAAGLVVFAALTAFGVFLLPKMFPPKGWVASDSYYVGFDNHISLLTLVVAAVVGRFLFKTSRDMLPELQATPRGLSGWHVVTAFLPSFLILLLGALTTQFIQLLTDYTYFYPKLLQLVQGGRLYTDVEFAYGPLQLYGPLLLTRLGISNIWAACAFWSVEQLIGFWMLLDLVQRLGIPPRAKWILFYTFSLSAPLLLCWAPTPDSLFFRLIVAPFLILRIEQIRATSIGRYVAIALSVPLLFACFLEVGIAFVLMQVCCAAFEAIGGERRHSVYRVGSAAAGLVLAAALFPSHSLAAIFAFGRGGNASPVVPSIYTLVFVAAFLYLATKVPLRAPLSGNDRSFFLLFVYSTALLPLAMSGGYGHIYQEIPIFLILLATLLAEGKPLKTLLAGAIILVMVQTVGIGPFRADRRAYFKHFIPIAFADLVHRTPPGAPGGNEGTSPALPPELGQLNPAYSRLLEGVAVVKVPFHLDDFSASEYDHLARTTRFDFGYFTDTWDVFTRAQMERKKAELEAHPTEPVLVEKYRLGAVTCPVNADTGHLFPRCEELSYFGQFLEQKYRVERSADNLVLLEPR